MIRDRFTEFARAFRERALRNVRGGGSRGDATIRASGPHSHARSLPPAVMFSTRVASLGVLAAAALLASASVASAECAPFCTRVPADQLASLERCETCDEEEGFAYNEALASCDDDDDGCCDRWCRWVPSNARPAVPRCSECQDESVAVGVGCPAWCNYVPKNVHTVVPPCSRCA